MSVMPMTALVQCCLQIYNPQNGLGLLVTSVDPDGQAGTRGVKLGDRMVEINGRLIPNSMPDPILAEMLFGLPRPITLGFRCVGSSFGIVPPLPAVLTSPLRCLFPTALPLCLFPAFLPIRAGRERRKKPHQSRLPQQLLDLETRQLMKRRLLTLALH